MRPFNRRLPLYGLSAAAALSIPKILFGNDIGTFLVTIGLALMSGTIILIFFLFRVWRQPLAALAMLVVFCGASWLLFKASDGAHRTLRWLAVSKSYKAAVLAQPAPADGTLKHVEWEGWGFVGSGDTTEYVVFDPTDSLAKSAGSRSPVKPAGLPCKVWLVRRMSPHWYIVRFNTDTTWDACNP